MKAFVLCGGKGTRLLPYTYSLPKAMLPLGKKPILEFVLNNLKSHGITEVILTVGYLKEQIKKYFGDGSKFGVKITYLEEERALNTAGSVLPGKDLVKETFLVLMGDHLTTVNLKKMVDFHKSKKAIATIGLKRQGLPLEFGIAKTDKTERVVSFEEKPIVETLVNAGIYIFEPEVFNYIKFGADFAMDVFPEMLAGKAPIYGYMFDDYWLDIGRINDYERINQLISILDLIVSSKR
ncbi:nucleotidyltransferase family protein [Candidatus Micrarchaeota archaeon]|nr:nucleotidyltransferase family protein [Candidatus Micrarchaeota archaeon]